MKEVPPVGQTQPIWVEDEIPLPDEFSSTFAFLADRLTDSGKALFVKEMQDASDYHEMQRVDWAWLCTGIVRSGVNYGRSRRWARRNAGRPGMTLEQVKLKLGL